MPRYLLRRILFFIPTLLIICLVSFILLRNSPGDPVDRVLQATGGEMLPAVILEKQKEEIRNSLGLNLPVFYFHIHKAGEKGIGKFIPAVSFHLHNQFHRWMFGDGRTAKGVIRGDFGNSYLTQQPVTDLIRDRIGWSLFFTLTSIFFAYLISIPVGIKAAANRHSAFDRTTTILLFVLYSLPVFWVATLLLMTFANPDVLFLFPAAGVKPIGGYGDLNFFQRVMASLPYLILPSICYTYSSCTFLSRLMRSSMLEILSSDYIRTARAKGLSEQKILWKHALKNSLFPVITVFAHVFPAMIGGSVIIESIFTIPGMGSAIYQSITAQDYPVLIAVFTITGLLTAVGYLVSDLLYAVVDPRISFTK